MYMYTEFCILYILWKQKEEIIDVHIYCTGLRILSILWKQKEESIAVRVYYVLYSQYSLERDRRKHCFICILGSVFSVFS